MKMGGTGTHRGFGFVEFNSKHDAEKAFESLSPSTHLYGRRLVLEWAKLDTEEATCASVNQTRMSLSGEENLVSTFFPFTFKFLFTRERNFHTRNLGIFSFPRVFSIELQLICPR